MSKTTTLINKYLLEFDIVQDIDDYFGDHMKLKHLSQKHQVVCCDRDCEKFKDVEQVEPGDVVYVEDEHGEMNSYKIT